MYNYLTREEPQPRLFPHTIPLEVAPIPNRTNKFVYVKQNYTYTDSEPKKVLINPNFNKKVFINPNFNRNVVPPKIHINPHIQSIKLGVDECKNVKKILVNPNVLRNLPISTDNRKLEVNCNKNLSSKNEEKVVNTPLISTRTKLVRVAAKTISENRIRKRRSSIRSQFKIIKSSLLEKSSQEEGKTKLKRNLIKSNPVFTNYLKTSKPPANKFKLDNRSKTIKSPKVKKYVYINRFLSISDIAKNNLLKQNKSKISTGNVAAINKKSLSPLTRNSNPYKKNNMKKIQGNIICKSKYRLMRKSLSGSLKNNQLVKQLKVSRVGKSNIGKNPSKLKICNVPCPYYRKFGRCKGKENGKCFRKHDPNKIALCTKFLQGACVDKKCLLSHNVSSEKMPTCKFYLEGSCARDDCPYLHVRINPKADICKEFLEGFCKKAAECDKRHQYLCPDYEKNGTCLKQRCPYPHGKMVRKYSEFNKNKFAKKCSDECGGKINITKDAVVDKIDNIKPENFKSDCFERISKSRYYIKHTSLDTEGKNLASIIDQTDSTDHPNVEVSSSIKSRPQLGKLPSFISFENKN